MFMPFENIFTPALSNHRLLHKESRLTRTCSRSLLHCCHSITIHFTLDSAYLPQTTYSYSTYVFCISCFVLFLSDAGVRPSPCATLLCYYLTAYFHNCFRNIPLSILSTSFLGLQWLHLCRIHEHTVQWASLHLLRHTPVQIFYQTNLSHRHLRPQISSSSWILPFACLVT